MGPVRSQSNKIPKEAQIKHAQPATRSVGATEHGSLAIAIPGSFITTVHTAQAKTLLVGQIARIAALFGINELVIYDEDAGKNGTVNGACTGPDGLERNHGLDEPHAFLKTLLEYLDTPPSFRAKLFPPSKNLRHVGLLRPIKGPHHGWDKAVWQQFREVLLTGEQAPNGNALAIRGDGSSEQLAIRTEAVTAKRLTVQAEGHSWVPVHRSRPSQELGIQWGYEVRLAKDLSSVFTECFVPGGYGTTIGVDTDAIKPTSECAALVPRDKHLLIVFGGEQGLQHAVKQDPALSNIKPEALFDIWTSPFNMQSLQEVALDETILITLSQLQQRLPRKKY